MISFLDLDGVIIDSIEECYQISLETYFGYAKFPFPVSEYKDLFYKYRGLVGPARQYLCLHRAIEKYCSHSAGAETSNVEDLFCKFTECTSTAEADEFERKFFFSRSLRQEKNFAAWIKLNPLTEFGQSLIKNEMQNICIITTKNKKATQAILQFYQIPVMDIFANDEIKSAGSKGALISKVLDSKAESEALFIDDSVEHLNTVTDKRVKCFFACWGYGNNTNYPFYEFR